MAAQTTTKKKTSAAGTNAASTRAKTKSILSYSAFFRDMAAKYGDMPSDKVVQAFNRALPFSAAYTGDPSVQNRRVKAIDSLPRDVSKTDIVEMLQSPDVNEQKFRETSNILEYTAYPMLKIRTTYQDLLTYHHYVYPAYVEKEDAGKPEFIREWRMMCKLEEEMQCKRMARQIVGQCVRDGKVFYVPRIDADKSHNQVRAAFMQQLPQDWVKIVGRNNVSKYSVAFDMFYFLQPGTSYKQFGDLFLPYIDDFLSGFKQAPKQNPRGTIFASRNDFNGNKVLHLQQKAKEKKAEQSDDVSMPDIYSQNGRWFYWVYLPVDKVWTFEIDDVKTNVVSPLSGLFLSMAQIAQYEQVQLEIVQNPLVSMVLGQIETYDPGTPTESDPMKVSPAGREFFQRLFYETMHMNNTGGIAIYSAPFKDMKLVQLNEAPNANSISAAGYEYAMEKSGMSALIPTTSDARAGVAQISLKLESRYAQHIYWQFERMMNTLMKDLSPKWEWRFRMFGDIATDDAAKKEAKEGMTLGILADTVRYMALNDLSPLDDMSISHAVDVLGVLNLRKPLVTSYSAKQEKSGLPPQGESQLLPDKGGRPKIEGGPQSEGGENDLDDGKGAHAL